MVNTSKEMELTAKRSAHRIHAILTKNALAVEMMTKPGPVSAPRDTKGLESHAKTSTNVTERMIVVQMLPVRTVWVATNAPVIQDMKEMDSIVQM